MRIQFLRRWYREMRVAKSRRNFNQELPRGVVVKIGRGVIIRGNWAIKDAETFDGEIFYPHEEKLFEMYPEIQSSVKSRIRDGVSGNEIRT